MNVYCFTALLDVIKNVKDVYVCILMNAEGLLSPSDMLHQIASATNTNENSIAFVPLSRRAKAYRDPSKVSTPKGR